MRPWRIAKNVLRWSTLLLLVQALMCQGEVSGPIFVQEPPNQVDFSNSTGTRIDCTALGHPPPSLKWIYANGEAVSEVPGLQKAFQNGTLIFHSFRADDYRQVVHAAIYRCVATNSVGLIVSRDVRIRAVVMQVYEVQVYNEFVIQDNTAVFKCHIPSFVTDYVKVMSWIRDSGYKNISIQNGERYMIMPSGELHIRQVGPNDANQNYRCKTRHRLTGEIRTSSTSGRLILSNPQGSVSAPRITGSRVTVSVREGETAVLPCAAQGYPAPSYSWYFKANKSQIEQVITTGRFKIVGGALIVNGVYKHDRGTFLCVVSNSVGNQTTETSLNVIVPFTVYIQPREQMVNIGKPASFLCTISGYPVLSVIWYKDGSELVDSAGRVQSGERFRIHSVQKIHKGMYQCMVKNDRESAQGTAELRLGDALPELSEHFREQMLHPGVSTSLRCTASGNPTPEIFWSLDDETIAYESAAGRMGQYVSQHGDVIGHFNISNIRVEDGGDYSCIARNRLGQSVHTARINVYGPLGIRKMKKMTVVAGDNMILKCRVTGYPIESITWEKDGMLLPVNRRQRVYPNGTLVVQDVRRESDGGKYICVVRNQNEPSVMQEIEVMILIPPKIIPFSFQDEDLYEGMRAQVTCAVRQGDLPITIKWLKDDQPIAHTEGIATRLFDGYTGSLSIDSVTSGHNGNYTCVASNAASTVNLTAQLHVNAPPVIARFFFQEDQLYEGAFARVTCGVTRGDLPITFTWMKDGRFIIPHELEGVAARDFDEYSSILTISNVTSRHDGNYTCFARNTAAETNFTARLKVNVPPRWLIAPPAEATVLMGNDVLINCRAEGFPQPSITWMKAVGDVPQEYREVNIGNPHLRVFHNGSLQIRDARESEQGQYLCQASNGIGGGLSKVFVLDVQVPVRFDTKIANVTTTLGESARLTCEAKGDQPISIHWKNPFIDSRAAASRFESKETVVQNGVVSTLEIHRIERTDSATFTCEAKNHYGQDSTNIMLIVKEAPEPPKGITVVNYGSRSVDVSWLHGHHGNSEIDNYIVQFKQGSDDWNESYENMTVGGNSNSAVITGLRPFAKYSARIIAINDVGRSSPSETVVFTTLEEAPGGPPQDIQVKIPEPQTLHISWQPPKKDFWFGDILGYNVGYRIHNSGEPYLFRTAENEDDGSGKVTLRNLKTFTSYEIIIQAYNRLGAGPPSDVVTFMTSEDVPHSPPLNLQCVPLTSQSIHVMWHPLAHEAINGVLLGYKLLYKVHQSDMSDLEAKVTSDSLETTLHGLEKYKNYTIQVLGFTRIGDGVASEPVMCRTKEDVPDAPANIKAVIVSSDTISISWQPSHRPNGIITKYTVYIRSVVNGVDNTTKHVVSPMQYQFLAKGLKRNRNYEIWITASTLVGEGQSTRMVSERPDVKVPARILSFGSRLFSPWKSKLEIPCHTVGDPKPDVSWKFNGAIVNISGKYLQRREGTLSIDDVRPMDSGEYVCTAINSLGKDSIVHHVIIQAPPSPPSLFLVSTSNTSITIRWKPSTDGGSSVQGYTLRYKREYGEWENKEFEPEVVSHVLDNLWCGTKYQISISASNTLGQGDTSDMYNIRTKGSAPVTPPKEKLMQTFPSFVNLNLNSWNNGGCEILYFIIEYKPYSSISWVLVSNNIKPQTESFVLPDLHPDTTYSLRITAHNSAGSTIAEYDFDTMISNQATMKTEDSPSPDVPFYFDLKLIISVAVATLGLTVILIVYAVCVNLRKKKMSARAQAESYTVQDKNVDEELLQSSTMKVDIRNHDFAKGGFNYLLGKQGCPSSPQDCRNHYEDDISPYATYRIPDESERNIVHPKQWHELPLKASNTLRLYPTVKKEDAKHCNLASSPNGQLDHVSIVDYPSPIKDCGDLNIIAHSLDIQSALTRYYPQHGPLETNVPDLLYHGTESSTSNEESSPDADWGNMDAHGNCIGMSCVQETHLNGDSILERRELLAHFQYQTKPTAPVLEEDNTKHGRTLYLHEDELNRLYNDRCFENLRRSNEGLSSHSYVGDF